MSPPFPLQARHKRPKILHSGPQNTAVPKNPENSGSTPTPCLDKPVLAQGGSRVYHSGYHCTNAYHSMDWHICYKTRASYAKSCGFTVGSQACQCTGFGSGIVMVLAKTNRTRVLMVQMMMKSRNELWFWCLVSPQTHVRRWEFSQEHHTQRTLSHQNLERQPITSKMDP